MKKMGLTMFLFLFTNLDFALKIATFPDLLKPAGSSSMGNKFSSLKV
jgi:hypothetical protein